MIVNNSEYNNLSINELLEHILEAMHNGICITDGNGIILSVSNTCEQLYGISQSDVKGQHISLLEKEGIFKPSATMQVLEKKEKVSIIQPDKNGQKLFVTGVPIFNNNTQEIEFVITYASLDVMRFEQLQKQYDELREEMKLRSEELREFRRKTLDVDLVAESVKMKEIRIFLREIAGTDLCILLVGKKGVGKVTLAKHIHRYSGRHDGAIEIMYCSAFPSDILEDELFGYVKFNNKTGSDEEKTGMVEIANEGTLVLADVEHLNWDTQGKLLCLLQNNYYFKSGSKDIKELDVRIVATTNVDLFEEVKLRRFREELYYRLNVALIQVPALQNRKEDILPLITLFLNHFNGKYKKEKKLSQQTIDLLMSYNWPGNVRELKYLIERLVITVEDDIIKGYNLPSNISPYSSSNYEAKIDLKEYLEYYEGTLISQAYEKCKTTIELAKFLGISQATAVRKIKKYISGKE